MHRGNEKIFGFLLTRHTTQVLGHGLVPHSFRHDEQRLMDASGRPGIRPPADQRGYKEHVQCHETATSEPRLQQNVEDGRVSEWQAPVNETMNHKGKTITSNVFMAHYSEISRLDCTKEERERNREVKNRLRARWLDVESTRDCTMEKMHGAGVVVRGGTRSDAECDRVDQKCKG